MENNSQNVIQDTVNLSRDRSPERIMKQAKRTKKIKKKKKKKLNIETKLRNLIKNEKQKRVEPTF